MILLQGNVGSCPPCSYPCKRAVARWSGRGGGGGGMVAVGGPTVRVLGRRLTPPPPRGLRPTISCQRYQPKESKMVYKHENPMSLYTLI